MDDDDPLSRRIGSAVGAWQLEELLGAGGMATVFRGRSADGSARAIKILHPRVARNPELRARFVQEIEAVSRLQHPGIVRIEDLGATPDGCPYLVMELLSGESLSRRLERGLPSQDEALAITEAVLDALSAAHRGRIVHRDIKPDNLFILEGGGVKVLDFGVARVRRESMAHIVTQTGVALGTPSYMPQEQVKGVDVDHRADLFAAGAVLFRMLTGRRIHEETTAEKQLIKMLTVPAPPLLSVAPALSPQLALVVDRAIAFEPKDRYPNAITMRADVSAVRQGRVPPHAFALSRSPAPAPARHARPAVRWRLPLVIAAGLLIGVVGVLIFVALGG